MAKAIPNPEFPANRGTKGPAALARSESALASPDASMWHDEATPYPDLLETGIENADLLAALSEGNDAEPPNLAHEAEKANAEVARLRDLVLETQRDYESRLQERDEVIESLSQKNAELEQALAARPNLPNEEELASMSEELERERCQLQQQRRDLDELRKRLEEDEQHLHKEMREMELQMARERADFARRRSELQRILEEIRRELEKAERNGHLNQRLVQLRDRFHDLAAGRAGSHQPPTGAPTHDGSQAPNGTANGGVLRRFFK